MQGVDPKKFTAFNVLEDQDLRSGMFTLCASRLVAIAHSITGIKEYSDWPTIPQLYVGGEFVGGCDILMNMHKDGSLADLLAEKKVIIEEEDIEVPDNEMSAGGRSKDAKGERS